ncbi:MAG: 23S rRNA (uracil(1939)-C(5))-methyltransferase RlmD [Deltaproteobacteria bacterium]|nr:23S rRNA (uracil(1939)-C(5))-methyltransferase RlmD [Deltaproteobacteria bacterium]
MNTTQINIKKNQSITITIDSVAYGGKGIARLDNFVIFVRDALPGQHLKVKIIKKKPSFAEAIIEEIITQSPDYIDPKCIYFNDCGGCTFQNLRYLAQLKIKKQQIEDVYTHLTKLTPVKILEPLASPEIWGYRNKMEFSAGDNRWLMKENDPETPKDFAIGLHAPRRFDKILDVKECFLQNDTRNKIFADIRKWMHENKITLDNPRHHTGFLRNIMIREGAYTNEIMINFITRENGKEILKPLIDDMIAHYPEITSVVNNVTKSKGQTSQGGKEFLLYGNSVIHDTIGGIQYEISANAFFQTNTKGAEQLYGVVRDFAKETNKPVIWDFYSGIGSIALFLADVAKKVYGFEVCSAAVKNANENTQKNNINNCEFFEANLDKFLQTNQELIQSLLPPDIVVVDPPRAGIHPKFLKQMVNQGAPKIIYVSCNPSTQARDIEQLVEHGYKVEKIQPVDMFPHTWHIESVALLTKW